MKSGLSHQDTDAHCEFIVSYFLLTIFLSLKKFWGVPTVVQRVKNPTAAAQVSCGGEGSIPGPMQCIKVSGVTTAVMQVASVSQIQSLAQELPYAAGTAMEKKNQPLLHLF